jgi:hypothetical protein
MSALVFAQKQSNENNNSNGPAAKRNSGASAAALGAQSSMTKMIPFKVNKLYLHTKLTIPYYTMHYYT